MQLSSGTMKSFDDDHLDEYEFYLAIQRDWIN